VPMDIGDTDGANGDGIDDAYGHYKDEDVRCSKGEHDQGE
jgi:hypothetical protein